MVTSTRTQYIVDVHRWFVVCYFSSAFGKVLACIGFLSLWLLSTPFVAYNLVDILQNKYPILQPDLLTDVKASDAIVVLGGGDAIAAEYGNRHTVSDFTLHRLQYAAFLHKKTGLPIIVSGGKENGAVDSEADLMANVLRENYNITTLIKEDRSMTTADESKYLADLLAQHKMQNIYLVTNAWHMPRAVFIFHCAGVKVTPAPMGYYVYDPGYALISFLPSITALFASSIAIHEYLGLGWYYLNYRKSAYLSTIND